jgi:hypothetical protein
MLVSRAPWFDVAETERLLLDVLGHVGYVLLFIGQWQVGDGKRYGFLLRLAGEVVWVGLGFCMGYTSIWIWSLVFAYVEIRNFRKWNTHTRGR